MTRYSFWRQLPLTSILLGVLSPWPVMASEDLFFEDFPIVASVSRLPQPLSETPASVTVIDQEMIRASGMRTVEDLLRLVPGFQVASHNKDSAIVAYHGLNSGMNTDEYGPRVQVLVDGRSEYSPLFKSGVNWNLLPVALENIERIEVTRGANTVSYGSNAFMGVINIITLDTTQTPGWMTAVNVGNNQIRDETLRWGGKVGEADVRFTARQLSDGGFQNGLYSRQWMAETDDRRTSLLELRADLPLTHRDELGVTASLVKNVSGYGQPGSPVGNPIYDFNQSSAALGLLWRHFGEQGDEYKLRYAYVQDDASANYLQTVNMNCPTIPPVPVTAADKVAWCLLPPVSFVRNVDPGGKSIQHELEFEHVLTPVGSWRAVWGGGLKSIELHSVAQFSTNAAVRRQTGRVFGNLEYRPTQSWLFNFGAGLENDSRMGWMFDPRASISYHLMPGHTARFGASRAHRNPSLYEIAGFAERRDPSGSGLTNIDYFAQGVQPERVDTLELGYLGELKLLNASVDVRAFIERMPNRIQIIPMALPASQPDNDDPMIGRYLAETMPGLANTIFPYGRADSANNVEDVKIRGYEYQLRWQPTSRTRLIYNGAIVAIDASLTDVSLVAESSNENTTKIPQQTRESAPLHAQSAMLIQKLPYNLTASVMYFRSGSMRWRRNGNPLSETERIDWRLAKSFRVGGQRGEVAYTVQMANGPQYGRNTTTLADRLQWLSLRLDF